MQRELFFLGFSLLLMFIGYNFITVGADTYDARYTILEVQNSYSAISYSIGGGFMVSGIAILFAMVNRLNNNR